jgi:hypothetical protein
VQVGEDAAASAGNQNLLADSIGAFEHYDAASALTGFDGAHQAGGACSEDDYVVVGRLFWHEIRLAGAVACPFCGGVAAGRERPLHC